MTCRRSITTSCSRNPRKEDTGDESNDFKLNISRYVSTSVEETEIDLAATHSRLVEIESAIHSATAKHNEFLQELGLPLLPSSDQVL